MFKLLIRERGYSSCEILDKREGSFQNKCKILKATILEYNQQSYEFNLINNFRTTISLGLGVNLESTSLILCGNFMVKKCMAFLHY